MSNFNLRLADIEDMELLFNWANEKEVRKNSFSTGVIEHEEHKRWFTSLLEDSNSLQYIFELNGTPIGQIRIIVDGEKASIGYSIGKEYRHMGYGEKMLSLVCRKVREDLPSVRYLVGEVKTENIASQKAFINAGFSEKYKVYKYAL